MKKNSPPAMTRHSWQTGSGRALLSDLENKAYWSGRSESRRPLALELDIELARTWSSFAPYPLHGSVSLSGTVSAARIYSRWPRLRYASTLAAQKHAVDVDWGTWLS
jgi:hypothetical protein